MRFVNSKNQWFFRLTHGWEVDYLSKLPENAWIPFRYINEHLPAGMLHAGTLTICMFEGHTYDPKRNLILQCPPPRRGFLKTAHFLATSVSAREVVEDCL
jgi:hypothetical protein